MALIKTLKLGIKTRESIHKETDCSFFIVNNKKGEKYLQLDTYGSQEREILGKVSQSIQFSPEAISQLKEIILKEFKDR